MQRNVILDGFSRRNESARREDAVCDDGSLFFHLPCYIALMETRTEEWLRQADYDMETADYMWAGGRYLYAVFMCHLSIEKALKGLFYERQRQFPPKSHNFVLLMSG